MKSVIDIEDKLEDKYIKYCESKVAVLISKRLELMARVEHLHTELDKLSKEIDEFDYYESKLRIEYFGNDISRQNGIQAVKDFNYKTIYTDK